MWFTNPGNNTIGRISPAGLVRDFSGTGISNPWEITTGPDGALWFANFFGPSIGRITTKGASTCFKAAGVAYPQRITEGPDSALWFTIGGVDGGQYGIGRISKSGAITIYHLADYPAFITEGRDKALWFTYPNNNAIGRITTSGTLTSFTDPSISRPEDIAAGPDGALWFQNIGNNTIGRITTAGQVTSYSGPFGFTNGQPAIAPGPDGAMWFTNPATNTIGRITTNVTPWIFAKTPASGPPGTRVTIVGRNLQHASQVTFNRTPAAIISDTSTYLVAVVPPGATSGRIAITTKVGTATQNGWFTVTHPTP